MSPFGTFSLPHLDSWCLLLWNPPCNISFWNFSKVLPHPSLQQLVSRCLLLRYPPLRLLWWPLLTTSHFTMPPCNVSFWDFSDAPSPPHLLLQCLLFCSSPLPYNSPFETSSMPPSSDILFCNAYVVFPPCNVLFKPGW